MITEFAAACRTTAVAISEGLIAPLSMGDPSQSEIYVYNGIFFSKAEDSKDSFKVAFLFFSLFLLGVYCRVVFVIGQPRISKCFLILLSISLIIPLTVDL